MRLGAASSVTSRAQSRVPTLVTRCQLPLALGLVSLEVITPRDDPSLVEDLSYKLAPHVIPGIAQRARNSMKHDPLPDVQDKLTDGLAQYGDGDLEYLGSIF